MKKIKILIICICIIIIILLTSILLLINQASKDLPDESPYQEIEYTEVEELQNVKVRNNYYIVKNCVNKFYSYYMTVFDLPEGFYNTDDTKLIEEAQKQNAEAIYEMLDEVYIEYKQITKENILDKLDDIKTSTINITNMYVSEKKDNKYVYIVKGELNNNTTSETKNFVIMVKVDAINRTFSIIPQDYVEEKFSNIKLGDIIDIQMQEEIAKNTNNTYVFNAVSDEEYIKDLFIIYKIQTLYNYSFAYEHLNEEYKNKKFSTFTDFEEYMNSKKDEYKKMQLDKYKKTTTDSYTQYVCIDQNGKYYIFRETAPMNYTAILDTYTIDLPEFVEEYESATDENKVLLNIQKCFDAINDKDYKYVYNKLDDTFKANNFATLAEFEKYMQENTFDSNKIASSNGKLQGDIYMYNITIKDKTEKDTNTITKTFVMQLKEGTDFVMSFSV